MSNSTAVSVCLGHFDSVVHTAHRFHSAWERLCATAKKNGIRSTQNDEDWTWEASDLTGLQPDNSDQLRTMSGPKAGALNRGKVEVITAVTGVRAAIDGAFEAAGNVEREMDGDGQPAHQKWTVLARRNLSQLRAAILTGFGRSDRPSCLPKLIPAVGAAFEAALAEVMLRRNELRLTPQRASLPTLSRPSEPRVASDSLWRTLQGIRDRVLAGRHVHVIDLVAELNEVRDGARRQGLLPYGYTAIWGSVSESRIAKAKPGEVINEKQVEQD